MSLQLILKSSEHEALIVFYLGLKALNKWVYINDKFEGLQISPSSVKPIVYTQKWNKMGSIEEQERLPNNLSSMYTHHSSFQMVL